MNTRENIEALIIEKAMKDAAFRSALMENPKDTIAEEIGIKIPESVDIHILEESPNLFYLVLPPVSGNSGDQELSEQELLTVAAGSEWYEGGPNTQHCIHTDRYCP